jgi:hypothetical protein
MTDTRTFRLVKITGWPAKERANFAGHMVELVGASDRVDNRGAKTYVMLEGPMEGQEVWFTDDELTDFPRDPSTQGEW